MSVDSLRGATPVFPVSDVDATASWYRDELGFEFDTFPDVYVQVSGLVSLWDRLHVLVFAEQTSGADP